MGKSDATGSFLFPKYRAHVCSFAHLCIHLITLAEGSIVPSIALSAGTTVVSENDMAPVLMHLPEWWK